MFLQQKIEDFNKKFKQLKNMPNIVIWGAGVHTANLLEKTEILFYHIKDIVDIDKKKQGKRYFSFIIKSPEKVDWESATAVVLSVPGKEQQITEVLMNRLNFKGNIIKLYEDKKCTPFYLLYDEMLPQVRYLGDYESWDSAKDECNGYEDVAIIDKVISSTKSVLNGNAVWERDGYLFYEKKYTYKICAAILRCAVQNDNQGVRVLDIGGALGSTYFQNREYWTDVKDLEYIIVEQEAFANYGHTHLENSELKFIGSVEDYQNSGKYDIVLMSASLQYISNYKEMISRVLKLKPRYIILDRILVGDRTRICKETVPEEIYKSSYPVIIFSEEEIMGLFSSEYEVIERDISSVPERAYFTDGRAESRYFVFHRLYLEENNE